jgi:hypothetical protein
MFIPEFLPGIDQPGVSVYAAQPEYSDDPKASRSEKLTYVFAAGGEFEIPGVELDWWNTETSTIETTRLPAMSVRVTGPSAAVSPVEDAQRQMHPQRFAVILLLALAAGWALRHISAAIKRRRAKRKQQVLASEEYAFGQLQQALVAGDAHLSYSRMLEWLARLHADLDATAFVDKYGDDSLQQGLAELRGDLYAGTQRQPDLRAFASSLSKARKVYKLEEQRAASNLLPALNP